MEYLQSVWQVALIALAAGALIGALAYRLFAPSVTRANKVRSELETARQELIDYRASVNKHFDKTSELVNDLTQNYVKVYQHLAEGAQNLGGSRELNRLLEQQPGKVLLAVDDDSPAEQAESVGRTVASSPLTEEAAATDGEPESAESPAESDASVPKAAAEERPAQAAESAGESGDSEPTGDEARKAETAAGDEEKSKEPVIDVSKIEQGAAKPSQNETELGTLIPDPEKGEAIKPTRH